MGAGHFGLVFSNFKRKGQASAHGNPRSVMAGTIHCDSFGYAPKKLTQDPDRKRLDEEA
jgi:hypothetical protein